MKKKVVLLIWLVGATVGTAAQNIVRYGDSRYFFSPYSPTEDTGFATCRGIGAPNTNAYMEYVADSNILVYGMAITPYMDWWWYSSLSHPDINPDMYAMLITKEGEHFNRVDSVKMDYNRANSTRYFEYEAVWDTTRHDFCNARLGDTTKIAPVYEFYFSVPRLIFDTFYIGLKFIETNDVGLDRVFCLYIPCRNQRFLNEGVTALVEGLYSDNWTWGGVFPIIVPPDTDSFECPQVENFRRTRYVDGRPLFDWEAQAGQRPFQVAFGPADQEPDSFMVANASASPWLLPDVGLDSTVLYAARCRGRCHHTCSIHDTMVWGEWSDTVQFRIGNGSPVGIGPCAVGVSFALSPNPVKEHVMVTLGEGVVSPCEVVLCDEQGRELQRRQMKGQELTLSTQGLPAGLYYVKLMTQKGSATQKLVVEP